ncbi:hypothetical protein [Nocardia nova]|nr:hypothetical protein [Nocardia nova]
MTSSVDEARAILGLDDGDQVIEVFRAFRDAGGMRWSPQEAIHVELMPAEQYTKLAERPASLPKPPPDFDGRIGAMYYENRPPSA